MKEPLQTYHSVRGGFFLSMAFILAGSSVVAAQYVSDTLQPFTITFGSLFFAVVTAFIIHGRKTVQTLRSISVQRWKLLFLQSFFGIFLFRIFLTFGLKFTSAAESGIILGTAPAITATLTYLILRDPLSKRSILGILCSLFGLLLLQGFPFHLASFNIIHLFGNVLVLGATACESLFTILARKLHLDHVDRPMSPITQAAVVSVISLCLCFVPMLFETPAVALGNLNLDGWFALIWYGVFVTIIAFACMFTGAKYCDGYTIAAFAGVIPLSALILSILILGEKVQYYQYLGCAFIVLSIFIINRKESVNSTNSTS